jgi:hypothetical protein
MTLSSAYLLVAAVLAVPGVALASGFAPVNAALRAFPRSLPAALVFFGGAAAWFLWGITQLSDTDLPTPAGGFRFLGISFETSFRDLLVYLFGGTALLAFKFLRDFLAVRGLGILLLLSARVLLDVGYMQQPANLLLSSTAYLFVVLGLIWGVSPYRFRDWLNWILERRVRSLALGIALSALGAANIGAAVATM